jgi:hypothetical protein
MVLPGLSPSHSGRAGPRERGSIQPVVSSVVWVRARPLGLRVHLALVVAVAITVALTSAAASAAVTGTPPPGTPTARPFNGIRTVGPLFPPGSTSHTCTASVVASRAGDLLVTATHCIAGSVTGYTFAPGYRDGIEPFGSWRVIGAYASPRWISGRSPRYDFAFLVVARQRVRGRLRSVQSVTGANQLGSAPSPGTAVTVPAYATGRDDRPVTCTARVYFRGVYPAFNCTPYPDGTSGAPWLRRAHRGWAVVGVIGGLHQGGCYPWTSYSAPFGADTLRTYTSAVNGTKTSAFPGPERDGCTTGL